jgi:hypothetical protein
MCRSLARQTEAANFVEVLGYNARADMYFPAGIPLVALLALIAWNIKQEADRQRAAGQPSRKPR